MPRNKATYVAIARILPPNAKEPPDRTGGSSDRSCDRSDHANVLRLFPLAAGTGVELDPLALLEGAVAVALDRRVVDEHVVTLLARDETVTLFRIEELDRTCCHEHSFLGLRTGQPPTGRAPSS